MAGSRPDLRKRKRPLTGGLPDNRPAHLRGFTPAQADFVMTLARGWDVERAAAAAGYTLTTARQYLTEPKFREAIRQCMLGDLVRVGAKGLREIEKIIDNPESDPRLVGHLAKWAVEQVVGKAPERLAEEPADKQELIARVMAKLIELRPVIDGEALALPSAGGRREGNDAGDADAGEPGGADAGAAPGAAREPAGAAHLPGGEPDRVHATDAAAEGAAGGDGAIPLHDVLRR
jgi:hypothetical protein